MTPNKEKMKWCSEKATEDCDHLGAAPDRGSEANKMLTAREGAKKCFANRCHWLAVLIGDGAGICPLSHEMILAALKMWEMICYFYVEATSDLFERIGWGNDHPCFLLHLLFQMYFVFVFCCSREGDTSVITPTTLYSVYTKLFLSAS